MSSKGLFASVRKRSSAGVEGGDVLKATILPQKTTTRRRKKSTRSNATALVGSSVVVVGLLLFVLLRQSHNNSTVNDGEPEKHQSSSSSTKETIAHIFSDDLRESTPFVLPKHLHVGELQHFQWKKDSTVVDRDGGMIGLPPELTQEIYKFAHETGLLESFQALLYDNDEEMTADQVKILDLEGSSSRRTWTAMSPEEDANWGNSNIRWIDAADERSFEEMLPVLRRGNFDLVLDEMGHKLGSASLAVAGVGFIIMSYTMEGDIHEDLPGTRGKWWDLLFPLVLPKQDPANLVFGDYHHSKRSHTFPMIPNVGSIVGGDTRHATGLCDFRASKEYRAAVSIYIVDVNKDNASLFADDGTAIFPIPGNSAWYLAQRGRLWNRKGGKSLQNDKGRLPFNAQDQDERCKDWAEKGLCEEDLWGARLKCLKSCKIFIDDEEYFSNYFPRANAELQ